VLTVRDAVPADAMAVAGVHVRSWQEGYRGLLPQDYLDGLSAEDRAEGYKFHLRGAGHPATMVAVDAAARIHGFVTVGPGEDTDARATAQLLALYVDPHCWGSGAGRTLMRSARSRLAGAGYRRAVLWMFAGNRRAERFYLADGWQPDGRSRRERGWGIEVVGYQKRL